MSLDPVLLEAAIRRDDAAGVRALLLVATEADRRECARVLRPLLDGPDLARLGASATLVDRKLRDRHDLGLNSWVLARALVRLGAIERPDVPQYTTKMPRALCERGLAGNRTRDCHVVVHPQDALLADPGLLDDEIWRLFTVPDAAAELARYEGCWEDALVALSEQGGLDRGRLLDACLDAFTLDFAPNRVGWYATFHDRMNPSLEEMAVRSARYLRLLGTGSRPAIRLGQKICGRLLEAGRLAADDFLAACGPALLFPVKTVAAAQLKLIATVAAAQPQARPRALATAAVAFGHDRLGIQVGARAHRQVRPAGRTRASRDHRAGRLAGAGPGR